jgi:hypothetical protein
MQILGVMILPLVLDITSGFRSGSHCFFVVTLKSSEIGTDEDKGPGLNLGSLKFNNQPATPMHRSSPYVYLCFHGSPYVTYNKFMDIYGISSYFKR